VGATAPIGKTFSKQEPEIAAAGVDPYAILRSSTVDAADALHMESEIGVAAPGARAELILVAGNPLEDLSVLRRPHGVLMNGRYYDRAALDVLDLRGKANMSTYATIGWLLWHQITDGEG
jgi:adenine deaminase